jgi:hypothetical protein
MGSGNTPVRDRRPCSLEDLSGLTAKVTADGPNDFDYKLTNDSAGTDRSRGSGDGRGKVRN